MYGLFFPAPNKIMICVYAPWQKTGASPRARPIGAEPFTPLCSRFTSAGRSSRIITLSSAVKPHYLSLWARVPTVCRARSLQAHCGSLSLKASCVDLRLVIFASNSSSHFWQTAVCVARVSHGACKEHVENVVRKRHS